MVEVVYSNLDNNQASKDLDDVQYTRSMWQKFVQSALMLYASTLVTMDWIDIEAPTLYRLAYQLW